MAAPKGKGGGGGSGKKAKLAHEKRSNEDGGEKGQFRIKNVIELVNDASGNGAVAELDDKGTLGIVSSIFVLKSNDGSLKTREVACPATYDVVAQKAAIQRYQAYKA